MPNKCLERYRLGQCYFLVVGVSIYHSNAFMVLFIRKEAKDVFAIKVQFLIAKKKQCSFFLSEIILKKHCGNLEGFFDNAQFDFFFAMNNNKEKTMSVHKRNYKQKIAKYAGMIIVFLSIFPKSFSFLI